jgi:hypothetical protein
LLPGPPPGPALEELLVARGLAAFGKWLATWAGRLYLHS